MTIITSVDCDLCGDTHGPLFDCVRHNQRKPKPKTKESLAFTKTGESVDKSQQIKAIEFAEHMAKAAENYITAVDNYWDMGDELTEAMLDELKDSHNLLTSAVHEFRKLIPNVMGDGYELNN